ncbi:hypothetical protein UFOVP1130_42 [uncultured Caudovirales phage]|uniref:Uncharacterized protein n=1 Tax=uncultured Caudovirales phage TaxID=2100421 RepID=A0A6J5QVJ4_9CAUD|nr:hypothetical protein UFOVP1130_42 [uncultured Caudovirales phage]
MAGGRDSGRDPRRKVGRGNMRNFGWMSSAPAPAGGMTMTEMSDNPANRRVDIGSKPDAERGKGHAPVVEFPAGNEHGVKRITGLTNHKTKMGARRAAKDMVRGNSDLLHKDEWGKSPEEWEVK